MVLRALHLCSGYGGFGLALRGVARTVAHVERDAYAAATLVARMEEQALDQAPIWADLLTFDALPWRGSVDIVTAGFPCQPFSQAGKRLGTSDDRWLWPAIARIIADVEPRYVFLENVPGVVRAGLPHVLGDLAALGFDAEWGLLAASDVGAPHRRQRFWLLADSDRERRGGVGVPQRSQVVGAEVGGSGQALGDPDRSGRPEVAGSSPSDKGPHGAEGADLAHGAGQALGNTESERRGPGERPRASEPSSWITDARESGRFPPGPDDTEGWAAWTGAQPAVCRGADGATEWLADALHLGGNGLVPQCARTAWHLLMDRLSA